MTMLWAAAFLVPLALATAFAVASFALQSVTDRHRSWLMRGAWIAVFPAGVLAWVAPTGAAVQIDWLMLGTNLAMDQIARPLTLLAVVVYGVALMFIPRSVSERGPGLCALLLLCFVGNLVAFTAADAVTFYLGFTVMSFVGYALVVHSRNPDSQRAGQIYLVMTVLGECAVLAAVMLTVASGGLMIHAAPAAVADSEQRDLIIVLFLIGFGVKAGTVPLHVWLPLAHPAAPTPASAVLSGVMIKAGLIGWLRFLPLGEVESRGWAEIVLAVALVGAFVAVPIGLLQSNPKVVLAYSSISQMGFLAALIGVALYEPAFAPACIAAAVVYALHHGMAKGALFLGIDAWGRYANRAVVGAGLVLAAVAVIGAPVTSGHIAKYAAKEAVGSATVPLGGGVDLTLVLTFVGLGSTLLLARFGWLVVHSQSGSDRLDPVAVAWWGMVPLGFGATWWFGVRGPEVLDPPAPFDLGTWTDQLWPMVLGLVLASGVAWASVRDIPPAWLAHPRGDVIPPGDLVVPEERVVQRGAVIVSSTISWWSGRYRAGIDRVIASLRVPRWVDAAQSGLDRWVVSGVVTLVTLAVAVVVMVGGR